MNIVRRAFELADWIEELERELEENGGELTPIIERESEVLERARMNSLEDLAKWLLYTEAEMVSLEILEKNLKAARGSLKGKIEFIKHVAGNVATEKTQTPLGTFSPRVKRELAYAKDFSGIDEKYLKYAPSLNKSKVNEDLEFGLEIDGITVTERKTSTFYKKREKRPSENEELD